MKTGRYGTPDWRQLATGGLRKLGCLSTALLATLWHPASSVQAQTFRSVIVFGDSLSDSGNTADLQTLQAPPHLHYPEGTNFSTNPDWVWTQYVEQFYGGPGEHRPLGRGGTNYAMGGGCISTEPSSTQGCNEQVAVRSQIMRHLGENGQADPDSLYVIWGGSNDLNLVGPRGSLTAVGQALDLGSPSAVRDSVHMLSNHFSNLSRISKTAALDYLEQIKFLQNQGAKAIVVLNMPPVGLAPGVREISDVLSNPPTSLETLISRLVSDDSNLGRVSDFINENAVNEFNQILADGLEKLDHGVIAIDVYDLFQDIANDPEGYGFKNITQAACHQTPIFHSGFSELPFLNDACGPVQHEYGYPYAYEQGANATYLFADNVHPGGASHRILADLVIATISTSAQMSWAQVDQAPLPYKDSSAGRQRQ